MIDRIDPKLPVALKFALGVWLKLAVTIIKQYPEKNGRAAQAP
jgi:hypothetical protein